MKKLLLLLAPLTLGLMVGCSYDDSAILDKIAEMEKEHDEMQAQLDAQQTLLDALANKLTITAVTETENGYIVKFSDGSTATISDGKDGDSFLESIVVGEGDVTFTLADGTVIVIPLGRGGSSDGGEPSAENNKIYYTSTDGNVVTPYATNVFGANIISNTYADGQGVITFDGNVTKIGGQAFYACSSLASITIPDSVTEIGDFAFSGCSSLAEFSGKFASEDGRCLIVNGKLNSFAPAGLTEYTIPEGVPSIGGSSFSNCLKLTSITIPNSVTSIGDYAFYNCKRLASITIPNSVTSIGVSAFWYCLSLAEVYCKAITPPTAIPDSSSKWGAFGANASGRKIYVPAESVEAYKTALYWRDYAADIVGYDFE